MHGHGDGGVGDGERCVFSVYFGMECRHAVGLFLPGIKKKKEKKRVKDGEREREYSPCIIGNRKFLIRTRVKNWCLAPQ